MGCSAYHLKAKLWPRVAAKEGYSRESRWTKGAFAGMGGRKSGMAGGVVAVGPGRAVEQRGRGRCQGPEQAATEAARALDNDGRIRLVPMLVIDVLEEVAGRDHFGLRVESVQSVSEKVSLNRFKSTPMSGGVKQNLNRYKISARDWP